MSNECRNLLNAKGNNDALAVFHRRMICDNFTGYSSPFRNFVPIPVELEAAPGFNRRQWCNENWGDKWDPPFLDNLANAEPCRIDNGNYMHQYRFETAWGPALKWLEKASALSPGIRLELHYFETGFGFAGISIFQNGECCKELYVHANDPEYQRIGEKYFPIEYECWLENNLPQVQKKNKINEGNCFQNNERDKRKS